MLYQVILKRVLNNASTHIYIMILCMEHCISWLAGVKVARKLLIPATKCYSSFTVVGLPNSQDTLRIDMIPNDVWNLKR